jgi:hypothetical protein
MLTAERLKNLLHYCPTTGIFTRKTSEKRWKSGDKSGWVHSNGYAYVSVDAVVYLAHRVAWLYMTGEWPKQDIDHIDGDKANNVFANLRDASEIVNCQNQKRSHRGTASGILGVYPRGKRWMSTICVNKKPIYLGVFDTTEEAYAAYISAKRLLHVGCTI